MKRKLINLIDLKSVITLFLVSAMVAVIFGSILIEDEAIKGLFISTTSSCFTYFFTKKGTKGQPSEDELNV